MKGDQKVEKFRLTQEQMAFQKTYRQLAKIARVLRGEMDLTARRGATLGQLMQELNGQMSMLLESAPQEPVHELLGQ